MKFELTGWSSEGFRCPDVDISVTKAIGENKKISLIQMPNGTGKTTTLNLLRATLSGAAKNWDPKKIRSFRRSDDSNDTGVFRVRLEIDDKPWAFELKMDFEAGTSFYYTTNPSAGGMEEGFLPPQNASKFFKRQFMDLFVFDGNFAKGLFDADETKADDAIEALCQLYVLDDMSSSSTIYWKDKASKDTTKSVKGLKDLQKKESQFTSQIEYLEKYLKKEKDDLGALKQKLSSLQKKSGNLVSKDKENKDAINKKKEDLRSAEDETNVAAENLYRCLTDFYNVSEVVSTSLNSLYHNFEGWGLPENTSKQFFEELVQKENCICGRPMEGEHKECILTNAEGYLGEESQGIINEVKGAINDSFSNQIQEENRYSTLGKILKTKNDEFKKIERDLVKMEKESGEKMGGEEFVKTGKEIQKFTDQIKLKEYGIESIDGPEKPIIENDPKKMRNLRTLRKKQKELRVRIADVSGTVTLRNKTEIFSNILDKIKQNAQTKIKKELIIGINEKLEKVLKNDPLRVEEVEGSIVIKGQDGGSSGQELAIGYVFLISLLHRGQNEFPLVIDSPALPMDLGVRRRTARIIPDLCYKFITFITSAEKQGFVSSLEKHSEEVQYLTFYRKTDGTKVFDGSLPKEKTKVTITPNSVLVKDKQFFNDFDYDEEDE